MWLLIDHINLAERVLTTALITMSRSLRQLAQLAKQVAKQAGEQRTFVTETGSRYTPNQYGRTKPMDRSGTWIPKNPFIESWVYRRDKFEKEFSWSARNTFELAYYIGGITVGFYALSVWTTRHSDARNNYPKRELLGSASNTGFVLPDEREWCVAWPRSTLAWVPLGVLSLTPSFHS